MRPCIFAAIVNFENLPGQPFAAGCKRQQQAYQIIDMDDRQPSVSIRRQRNQSPGASHFEQVEHFAVAGAVNRRGADNCPIERGRGDKLFRFRFGRTVDGECRLRCQRARRHGQTAPRQLPERRPICFASQ